MPARRIATHGRIPLALQTMALENSTAGTPNSTTRTADVLHFSVETNDVRYSMNGDAALTTGVLLQKDMDYWLDGYNGTAALSFQRSTGAAAVIIQPYKYEE